LAFYRIFAEMPLFVAPQIRQIYIYRHKLKTYISLT